MNLHSRIFHFALCLFYLSSLNASLIGTLSVDHAFGSSQCPTLSAHNDPPKPASNDTFKQTNQSLSIRHKRSIPPPSKWSTVLDLVNLKPCSGRNTRFYLYTRRNPVTSQELCISDGQLLRQSYFDRRKPTIILASGWLDNRFFAKWVREGLKALLQRGDYNVVYVAWHSIKELFVAAAVIRRYSDDLARFVRFLKRMQVRTESLHCIGHSLGAFMCAFASEKAPMRRVTVLDAGPRPYYEKMHWTKRINRLQADQFVDVIHSDFNPNGFSLGLTIPLGDVDFYPNAGTIQTGCWRDKWFQAWSALRSDGLAVAIDQMARYSFFCSHYRAHEWFFESITNRHCPFVGVLCPSYEMFLAGECSCDSFSFSNPHVCAPMGFDAESILPKGVPRKYMKYYPQGKWYLKTSDFVAQTGRHCEFQYQLVIKLGRIVPSQQNGTFRVSFRTKHGIVGHELVHGRPTIGLRSYFQVTKLILRPNALPLTALTGIYISYSSSSAGWHSLPQHWNTVSVSWVKLSPILMNTEPIFFCDHRLQTDSIQSSLGTYLMEPCFVDRKRRRF